MQENIEIFDFSLDPTEMNQISDLNRDERTGPDPDTFDYVPD
jgi:2,5-diketo-D-gluconate reductase A